MKSCPECGGHNTKLTRPTKMERKVGCLGEVFLQGTGPALILLTLILSIPLLILGFILSLFGVSIREKEGAIHKSEKNRYDCLTCGHSWYEIPPNLQRRLEQEALRTIFPLTEPIQLTIASAKLEITGLVELEQKLIIRFVGMRDGFAPAENQIKQLAQVCGSEQFSDWIGCSIMLSPDNPHSMTPRGRSEYFVSAPLDSTETKS